MSKINELDELLIKTMKDFLAFKDSPTVNSYGLQVTKKYTNNNLDDDTYKIDDCNNLIEIKDYFELWLKAIEEILEGESAGINS